MGKPGIGDLTPSLSAPGYTAFDITTSDVADLSNGTCRSIYVGTTGDLSIVTAGDDTVTFNNVPVGVFPMRAKRVRTTGTTAGGLRAIY